MGPGCCVRVREGLIDWSKLQGPGQDGEPDYTQPLQHWGRYDQPPVRLWCQCCYSFAIVLTLCVCTHARMCVLLPCVGCDYIHVICSVAQPWEHPPSGQAHSLGWPRYVTQWPATKWDTHVYFVPLAHKSSLFLLSCFCHVFLFVFLLLLLVFLYPSVFPVLLFYLVLFLISSRTGLSLGQSDKDQVQPQLDQGTLVSCWWVLCCTVRVCVCMCVCVCVVSFRRFIFLLLSPPFLDTWSSLVTLDLTHNLLTSIPVSALHIYDVPVCIVCMCACVCVCVCVVICILGLPHANCRFRLTVSSWNCTRHCLHGKNCTCL